MRLKKVLHEHGPGELQEVMLWQSNNGRWEFQLFIEDFLNDNGAANFVRNLGAQFENVRFFSCSSVGLAGVNGSGAQFEGLRVLAPLLWLFGSVNAMPVDVDGDLVAIS